MLSWLISSSFAPSYIARSPSNRRCDNSTISSPVEHANSFCVMITGNRCFQRGRIRVVFLQAVEGPTFVYAYGLLLSDDVQAWEMRNAEHNAVIYRRD